MLARCTAKRGRCCLELSTEATNGTCIAHLFTHGAAGGEMTFSSSWFSLQEHSGVLYRRQLGSDDLAPGTRNLYDVQYAANRSFIQED